MSAFSVEELVALRLSGVIRGPEAMHPYQHECVDFLIKNPFSALFIDMGMGKTISSLTVIAHLISMFEAEKVLVVAPLKVATDTWPTEIGLWEQTAWMSHTLIRADDDDPRLKQARRAAITAARAKGLSTQEANALGRKAETEERHRIMEELAHSPSAIHIINREQVEWLVYLHKDKWPYRVVFIDESSSFKDHNSKRFKALAKVRNTPGLIERLHILTATPAAETYEHLFAQLFLVDRGQRLGKNITAYRDRFFTYNRYSMKYKLRPGAEEQILDLIKDICLVMKAEDYLPREKPTIIARKVKLAANQLDLIKKLEKDFVITLSDGTEIEAKTAAMLSQMMLQMASGSLYETLMVEDWDTDDLKKVKRVHHIHDHKIDTLREIVEECATQGEPLLVAYHFQSSLAKLKKAFPKAVVMDKAGKCIKAWNAGKIPILLLHPQSAGHGLNLQYGGRMMVFYDLIYSLENYLQIIGRIDRQGQTRPVVIQLLVAEGTRDEDVFACLNEKKDAQDMLFSILKRLIRLHRKNLAC